MRVLLDTNIIIHREASRVIRQEIGVLFYWLDRLSYEKCIHPSSLKEIRKHKDPSVVATFEIKTKNYHLLKTQSPETPEILSVRTKHDKNENDAIDTDLLKEVFNERVDILITEDRKVHDKASDLGISDHVFTIDTFLEKVVAENPDLADYRVLSVKKEYFGNININDPFFDSFKQDYPGFEKWFNRKADETAYICKAEDNQLLAFLYVKQEQLNENYSDIEPKFGPKRRLKIGTFKVSSNGYKLGERFLKIVFDNALRFKVEEIYVTLFKRTVDQERLIYLLQDWGFRLHGTKSSNAGDELVYVRDFVPRVDVAHPNLTYPFVPKDTRKFIVPIWPDYHTELFPDSILRTESPNDFIESRPNRNAISKVYISRSIERSLKTGDIIVFYRTQSGGSAYYTSVTTTIGIVQNIVKNIANLEQFIRLCRKRSVFSDEELAEWWNRNPKYRPFIVNFLYVYSFPKRLNRRALLDLHIIDQNPIRGFVRLTDEAFELLMEHSDADQRIIVH
ncbi:MAG TPA: PIN domain-containing protein [Sphingobacteriaceae bacterium]